MWTFLLDASENFTVIAIITVIVAPLTDPGAERFLLVVDVAQELAAAVHLFNPTVSDMDHVYLETFCYSYFQ